MNNKESVYNIVMNFSKGGKERLENLGITTQYVAQKTGLKRNFASRILNELFEDNKLIKINTRPVVFIAKETLGSKADLSFSDKNLFKSYYELQEYMATAHEGRQDKAAAYKGKQDKAAKSEDKCTDPFEELIGYDGSLHYQVEHCKAAVRYPPEGLPILITGPTGSGKSFLAGLMVKYAKERNIIEREAPLIIFNCAEYADNPELLSANLFGYTKGSFTGAERDTKGVIEEADGGFLFLDEIHRLSPKGQERLFLFMDKGIFRRLGESKDLRTSKVRLVFATTEIIENFLIDTFLRRIPIVISLPSLNERPLNEKLSLIYKFFYDEAKAIRENLIITKPAVKALLYSEYKGNVGQLRNVIKLSCASVYNDHCNKNLKGECMKITLLDLPDYLSTSKTEASKNFNVINDVVKDMIIDLEKPMEIYDADLLTKSASGAYKLYDKLLVQLKESQNENFARMDTIASIIDDLFDNLILSGNVSNNDIFAKERFNMIYTMLHDTFGILKNRFDLKYYDSMGYKISCYIMISIEQRYFLDANGYDREFKKYYDILKDKLKQEYIITNKLAGLLKSNYDISLNAVNLLVLMLYLKNMNKLKDNKKIKAVIIAHGYYTASSIANVANYLLGEHIFESFDMPVDVMTQEILGKLRQYLEEIDTSKGIIILVDMGSLEEIYEGLEGINHGVIGVVNNITTQLALDTGNKIMRGLAVEDIVEEVTVANHSRYKIIKPTEKKKNALITTCITGIGTAIRIKDLLLKSLAPYENDLEIIAYDYHKLKNNGHYDSVFENYNVVAIIGTKDPLIKGIPFFSLEEIISGEGEGMFSKVLEDIINEEGIQQINQSILKYFSLESVLNYITILNPKKIIDQIEVAIEALEYEMKVHFTNGVKISLYVHLGCLIERLVTHNQIDKYNNDVMKSFIEHHQEFINAVKKSFSPIEQLYSVNIPLAEIYFVYEILSAKMPDVIKDAE